MLAGPDAGRLERRDLPVAARRAPGRVRGGVAGHPRRPSSVACPVAPADLEAAYATVRATSIDYAVLEPAAAAGRVAMLRASVGWSDLGSWSALRDALAGPDAAGVVGRGPRSDLGSERTLVIASDRPVVTIGLRDVIVVDAGDVILVAAADASQQVKVAAGAVGGRAEAMRPAQPARRVRPSRYRIPTGTPPSV